MRRLAYFFLLSPAWGQPTLSPPTVRDAYVQAQGQGDLTRTARLKDYLRVVVCKSEYDAWAQTQNTAPALSLYMDGRLMKGLEAAKPALAMEPPNDEAKDEQTRKVKRHA